MPKRQLTAEERAENAAKNAPIVARIDALRSERGFRVDAMCKGAGITPSAISQWRSGLTVATVDSVEKLATFFGVDFAWLFTGIDTEKAAAPEGDGELDEVVRLLKTASPEVRAAVVQLLKAAVHQESAPGAQSIQK